MTIRYLAYWKGLVGDIIPSEARNLNAFTGKHSKKNRKEKAAPKRKPL
jgi:hypothetical protein